VNERRKEPRKWSEIVPEIVKREPINYNIKTKEEFKWEIILILFL